MVKGRFAAGGQHFAVSGLVNLDRGRDTGVMRTTMKVLIFAAVLLAWAATSQTTTPAGTMVFDRINLALDWHVRRIGYRLFYARRMPPPRVVQPIYNVVVFLAPMGIGDSVDFGPGSPVSIRIHISL